MTAPRRRATLANRTPPARRTLLIAHRGASHDAPENTHAAFRLAAAQGADGIECDVYLTRDQRIVCIHDSATLRTTGTDLRVEDATWTELRRLDAGRWKHPRYAGERIPLLADVLKELPPHMHIQVELKSGSRILRPLIPILRRLPDYRRRLTVIAFDALLVRALKRAAPDLCALWLTAYRRDENLCWRPNRAEILEALKNSGADGLGSQAHRALSPALARALHARQLLLCAWTVDRPASARRLVRLGVTAITTNRFLEALR